MTWFASVTLGIAIYLLAAPPALSNEPVEPFELVRLLWGMQDRSAAGEKQASSAQQELVESIDKQMATLAPEGWKDLRNARAALVFVLGGGGNPAVLNNLLEMGGLPDDLDQLARGALAYALGQNERAKEALLQFEPRKLEPGLAGVVALAQSALLDETDPAKAITYLDEARLLLPGTLIEEAALRRQITLLPNADQLNRLDHLLARYIRRFGESIYAPAFWHQLAVVISKIQTVNEPARLAQLADLFNMLPEGNQRALYLALSQAAISKGKIELARFAVQKIEAVGGDALRAQLYEAAALIVTDEYDRGLNLLANIERGKLARSDAELLGKALAVAREIRRPAEAMSILDNSQFEKLTGSESDTIQRARKVIANVDGLLNGTIR